MPDAQLYYTRHRCKGIEKDGKIICLEKVLPYEKYFWTLSYIPSYHHVLDEDAREIICVDIKYCPYCGEKLV